MESRNVGCFNPLSHAEVLHAQRCQSSGRHGF